MAAHASRCGVWDGPIELAVEAKYTNYFNVGHNAHEFVLDFGQFYSEQEHAHLHTRLVVGPTYARELATLLQEALQAHEEAHGPISRLQPDPLEGEPRTS